MSKYKLVLSGPAKRDFRDILSYTLENYGRNQAKSYGILIQQSLKDLESDPLRLGSKAREEIRKGYRTYHIRLSKNTAGSQIRSPRHLVLYFFSNDKEVMVSRILHDSMELKRHLPDKHKKTMKIAALPKAKKSPRTTKRKR